MSYFAIGLIVTGIVIIVISLLNFRHSPASQDYIAVHKNMSDERIEKQFSKGAPRSDAQMGIWFGVFLVVAGGIWQLLMSWVS